MAPITAKTGMKPSTTSASFQPCTKAMTMPERNMTPERTTAAKSLPTAPSKATVSAAMRVAASPARPASCQAASCRSSARM